MVLNHIKFNYVGDIRVVDIPKELSTGYRFHLRFAIPRSTRELPKFPAGKSNQKGKKMKDGIIKKIKPNEKRYGTCNSCGCELGKYHLTRGHIKVCSFECADKLKENESKDTL